MSKHLSADSVSPAVLIAHAKNFTVAIFPLIILGLGRETRKFAVDHANRPLKQIDLLLSVREFIPD